MKAGHGRTRPRYDPRIDPVNSDHPAGVGQRPCRGGPALFGRDMAMKDACVALLAGTNVVICGEPGVGKSALIAAIASVQTGEGRHVVRIGGASALTGLAFGALIGLIDCPAHVDSASVVMARRQLERACPSGAVLLVDDAQEIDEFSAEVIAQVALAGRPTVMAYRVGHPLPRALDELSRHGALSLFPQRLDELAARAMADALLGAPSDARTARRILSATGGLPLAIEHLCNFVRSSGMVQVRNGRARWMDASGTRWEAGAGGGRAAGTIGHLDEILGLGLGQLDESSRRVVNLVALAKELPFEVAVAAAPHVDLGRLEEHRLLASAPENGWLRCAHPLLRDAVVGELGAVQRRVLGEELVFAVDKVLADGAERTRIGPHLPGLLLRRTLFAVQAGMEVGAEDLAVFARNARALGANRGSLLVMERFWSDLPSAESALAFGGMLGALGEWELADQVLETAAALSPMNGDEVIALALEHSRCLQLGLADPERAASVLRRANDALPSAEHRLELAANLADLDLLRGEVSAVAGLWAEAVEFTANSESLYRLTQSAAPSLMFMGECERARTAMAMSVELRSTHGAAAPLVEVILGPWWASAAILAGCGAEEAADADRRLREAVAAEDSFMEPIWALPVAIDAWLRGDLLRAESLAGDAMGVGPAGAEVRQIARYLLARVLMLRGRLDAAGAVCADAEAESAEVFTEINHSWVHGSTALLAWHRGREAEAVDIATAAARRTADLGQRVPAAFLWSDIAEMGAVELAAAPLRSLAVESDAPVVRLLAERTEAVLERDGDALLAVARRAEVGGQRILGGSALRSALALALGSGSGSGAGSGWVVGAEKASLLSVLHALVDFRSGCTGLPASNAVAYEVLSPREVEVAQAAANGLSDREISELFVVSVRTVHAHLRSVYTKLGLGGRGDLAALGWLFSRPGESGK